MKNILIGAAIIQLTVIGLLLAAGSSPTVRAQEEDSAFKYLTRVLEDANERGLMTEDLSRTLGDLLVEYLIAPSTGETVQETKKRLGGDSNDESTTTASPTATATASPTSGENSEGDESGEHGEESESSETGEGGEESRTQLSLSETFDEVRAGARLILSYDSNANTFVGTVENTTSSVLSRVRVEVHLSNGTELGPTSPVDLAPGQIAVVVTDVTHLAMNS